MAAGEDRTAVVAEEDLRARIIVVDRMEEDLGNVVTVIGIPIVEIGMVLRDLQDDIMTIIAIVIALVVPVVEDDILAVAVVAVIEGT